MNRTTRALGANATRISRASGDEPTRLAVFYASAMYFPRERG